MMHSNHIQTGISVDLWQGYSVVHFSFVNQLRSYLYLKEDGAAHSIRYQKML